MDQNPQPLLLLLAVFLYRLRSSRAPHVPDLTHNVHRLERELPVLFRDNNN